MYVVNESMMNGTVTMGTDSHLIDVETFEEAVKFIQDRAATHGLKLINESTSDAGYWYEVEQPPKQKPEDIVLPCVGHIPKEPIEVLR